VAVAAFLSFVVTVLFMFALRPVAFAVGLVDIPGGRKRHGAPVPVIGVNAAAIRRSATSPKIARAALRTSRPSLKFIFRSSLASDELAILLHQARSFPSTTGRNYHRQNGDFPGDAGLRGLRPPVCGNVIAFVAGRDYDRTGRRAGFEAGLIASFIIARVYPQLPDLPRPA